MIKIKKITPELLQDGITFNDYKKWARPLFAAAKKTHKGVDNQVDFFILTNFEFSDKPGKKTTIFIPGKHTNEWKQYLKQKFKDDKKNVMIGKCFVSEQDGKEALNLVPERGNAKMSIISKQGKRMFQMAKLSVQLASGATEATNASGGRVEAPSNEEIKKEQQEKEQQEKDSNNTTESTTEKRDSKDKDAFKKMLKEQLEGLAAHVPLIKSGFNTVKEVVAKFKNKDVSSKEEEKLASVLDTLKEFVGSFDASHRQVQKRMKDAYKKVIAQMPKLELLHKHLKEKVEQKKKEEASKDRMTSNTGITPELMQKLQQQMKTAKAAIDKLKKELDLDALLAKVS